MKRLPSIDSDRPAIFVTLSALAFALLFHLPGRMSDDSVAQLSQARANLFSDAHPPIMAFLWRFLDWLSPGPMGLVFVHITGFALACHLLAKSIDSRLFIRTASFLAIFFFTPIFLLIGIAWKDISFFIALILALYLVYSEVTIARDQYRAGDFRRLRLGLAFAAMWYAIGVRYNGIFGVFPVAVVGIWVLLPAWHIARRAIVAMAVGAVACLCMFGSHTLVNKIVKAEPTNFWQVLAVYDIAGVSVATGTDRLDDNLFPGSTLEEIRKYYLPYSGLKITQESSFYRTLTAPSDLEQLRSDWFSAMLSRPIEYLAHRWRVTAECLGITNNQPWVPVYPVGIRDPQFAPAPSERSLASAILTQANTAAPLTLAHRPWAHLAFALIVLGLLWLVRSDRRGLMLFVTVVAVANCVSLFLLAHSPDFRFSIPTLFASACGLVLGAREVYNIVLATMARQHLRRPVA